jgi:alpha-ketoglutarate-dependent taurine dioxygenase
MLYDIEMTDPASLLSCVQENKLIRIDKHGIESAAQLVNFSRQLGSLLEWDFGYVNELKVDEHKHNYLFSNEAVPFHWDGAFHQSPYLLIFHCVAAPANNAGGETLFTDSEKLLRHLSLEELNLLQSIKLRYRTDKLVHYGGEIEVSPIQHHPYTRRETLRFAEPVETKLNPVSLKLEGADARSCHRLQKALTRKLYDPMFCYSHQWQNNDLLIADNHALLHGRLAFLKQSQRLIRRVQVLTPNFA